MKLEVSHDSEEKKLWKIVRTDSYAAVEGDIVSADEDTGECCVYVNGENKTLSFGPHGIRIVRKGRQ